MTTAAQHPVFLDHRGNPRPVKESPLTYEQARLGMAFHEAGHAVLAMSYGIHVASSEVITWTVEKDGWGLTGDTNTNVGSVNAWHYSAVCAVGALSEVQYLMVHGLWTPERAAICAAEHDRAHAVDVLAVHGIRLACDHVPSGGKSWGQVRGMARRRMDHLWREIRTVAHAMNEATRLTGEQIAAMTGLTNPPLPEAVAR
ncbi:hypothetical protein [Streptomyces vietnamensis]|uniref:Peptidase M41 domain-containing protein n=1 Tax=Streptomyces vietnamensis TaxID=362257 RepID=A0A0B5HWZ2_9ACTN|nr:hypothetical protein [Streptomyces vietnamensis]AJF64961.1 hypothetical protein SVTN_11505 [Streptomyces vietnamensis]